jgi:hypothetical protein
VAIELHVLVQVRDVDETARPVSGNDLIEIKGSLHRGHGQQRAGHAEQAQKFATFHILDLCKIRLTGIAGRQFGVIGVRPGRGPPTGSMQGTSTNRVVPSCGVASRLSGSLSISSSCSEESCSAFAIFGRTQGCGVVSPRSQRPTVDGSTRSSSASFSWL